MTSVSRLNLEPMLLYYATFDVHEFRIMKVVNKQVIKTNLSLA